MTSPCLIRDVMVFQPQSIGDSRYFAAEREAECHPAVSCEASRWGPLLVVAVGLAWCLGLTTGFLTALAFLTILGLMFSTIFITRPSLAWLGIGILCTLDTVARMLLMTGGLFRYNTLNYFLLCVTFFYLPRVLQMHGLQVRLLQMIVLTAAVGLSVSPSLSSGSQDLLDLIAPFGILAIAVTSVRQEKSWYWLGIVNGSLSALGGGVYLLQQNELGQLDHNEFAYFPLTGIFSICLACVMTHPRRQWPLHALGVVNLCWVFLSGSRGSLLVAACCAVFWLVQTQGTWRRSLVLASVVLGGLGLLSQFPDLRAQTWDRLESLVDSRLSIDERTSRRTRLAREGSQIFLEHPLGVGTGGFAEMRASSGHSNRWRKDARITAHSGWLKTVVENGLPGFLLLSLFAISFVVVAARSGRFQLFVFGLFVSITLSVAFLSTEFHSKGLWLFAAGSMAILQQPPQPH